MIAITDGMIRLGDLFDPIAGVLPSGIVTTDTISDTATTYTNSKSYSWTLGSSAFNVQGQKWETNRRLLLTTGYDGLGLFPTNYGGGRQVSTPRFYTAPSSHLLREHGMHVQEFEFVFTGQALSIGHFNGGGDGNYNSSTRQWAYGGDTTVYVEYAGRMWKLAENPKTTVKTSDGPTYRNITFAAPFHGRIRVVLGTANFDAIVTDQKYIVAPSKNRHFAIMDGDSYVESSQCLDADSSTQWFTSGIIDFLFEYTGFIFARRGQGATGFCNNGVGYIGDDTLGSSTANVPIFGDVTIGGVSRYLSASRVGWMTNAAAMQVSETVNSISGIIQRPAFVVDGGEDFGQPLGRRPLFYGLNGTWNDASTGGVSDAQMYARAKACYQLIRDIDPSCRFIHISPEPFDDTLFGNAVGAPRVGDKSYIHQQAQMRAAKEVGGISYVNAFGPDDLTRWWTGYGPAPESNSGTQGVPTNSQQAQLVSVHDGIHYRKEGGRYYAKKIAEAIAEVRVPAGRVFGLK